MKNNRTNDGFKPNLLAHQVLTPKNCFSKKLTRLFIFCNQKITNVAI